MAPVAADRGIAYVLAVNGGLTGAEQVLGTLQVAMAALPIFHRHGSARQVRVAAGANGVIGRHPGGRMVELAGA
ncbi:MAG: hypothetical protein WA015_08250, partial [Bryobacteraceae bacterium]